MFKSWVEENKSKISLYFRGRGASNLKFRCPLCGKLLHRVNLSGKFECKNSKCKLVYVELKKWEIKFCLEPLLSIKYDLRQTIRV
ncbi:MAG: hypothetical protein QXS10_05385 [Candidatus Bathyarchaeia archaeon]